MSDPPTRSKIYLTVFSQAYYVDAKWGFGCPSGGIKNFGDLCHKHGIPVTWLVSPRSARCESEMFTAFHEMHGDEIAMMIRFPTGPEFHHSKERDIAKGLSVDDYRALIKQQKVEIERYLPWAGIKVAGQGIRTPEMMDALRLEGFTGMFGHCYCQIGTDSITDFGMPWGSFPVRPGSAHLPVIGTSDHHPVIAFEWTMRDLNKSFHTTYPELWSTDPNDVERGGVCSDTNVEWWKAMFLEYELALPFNDHGIWFQFHQEAHEQTWGEVCKPMTEARVEFCTKMMDLFFEWLVKRDSVQFLTASAAAQLYADKANGGTIPMHVPCKWTPVPPGMDFWRQVRDGTGYAGMVHKNAYMPVEYLYDYLMGVNGKDRITAMASPPWTDSFFYFDGECQLVFDTGRIEPVAIFNYLNYQPGPDLEDMAGAGGGAAGYFLEPTTPRVEVTRARENDSILRFYVENPASKPLPFGLFLWNVAHPEFKALNRATVVEPASSIVTLKMIPGRGMFIRWNLTGGTNQLALDMHVQG